METNETFLPKYLSESETDKLAFSAKILSVLFYPDDFSKANDLACSIFADRTGLNSSREKRVLEKMGGYLALNRADSILDLRGNWDKSLRNWTAVAGVGQTIARMHIFHNETLRGGASISKAQDLVISMGESKENIDIKSLPANSNYIKHAWTRLKPVLHFCIAYTIMKMDFSLKMLDVNNGNVPLKSLDTSQKRIDYFGGDYDFSKGNHTQMGLLIEYRLPEFLWLAKGYQDFFLSFTPTRARSAIQIESEIVKLSNSISGANIIGGEGLQELSKKELEFLNQRYAPSPT